MDPNRAVEADRLAARDVRADRQPNPAAGSSRPASGIRNEPIIPPDIDRTVRMAAKAAPPSSALTVRINRAFKGAAPRKTGLVAATSERNAT